jgi:hypothetical protein
MIPVGYMAKRVFKKPDWLQATQVVDIYSVSGCISQDFADYLTTGNTTAIGSLTRQKSYEVSA